MSGALVGSVPMHQAPAVVPAMALREYDQADIALVMFLVVPPDAACDPSKLANS